MDTHSMMSLQNSNRLVKYKTLVNLPLIGLSSQQSSFKFLRRQSDRRRIVHYEQIPCEVYKVKIIGQGHGEKCF